MEENISKALSFFSVTFFIIIAVTLFFTLYEKNSEIINTVNDNISERGAVYMADETSRPENTVSGAFIIGCIKNGLETDISVDSVFVHKSTDISMFNFNIIDIGAEYTVEYVFNTSGEIILVKYQKTGGDR